MNESTLDSILRWHKTARPNPTDKDRSVSLGVHFEEVGEMLESLGELGWAEVMDNVGTHYKQLPHGPLVCTDIALLDALCDQIVTALGVADAYQFDILGALAEVNRINWSKFVDGLPIKDANGKISKPLGYSRPELSQFIRRYPESENEGSEP